jgi:hypothetical protein
MNQEEFQQKTLNILNSLSNGQAAIALRINSIESRLEKIEDRLRKIELFVPTENADFFTKKQNTPAA